MRLSGREIHGIHKEEKDNGKFFSDAELKMLVGKTKETANVIADLRGTIGKTSWHSVTWFYGVTSSVISVPGLDTMLTA